MSRFDPGPRSNAAANINHTLPNDRLFLAKNIPDSTLAKLIRGLAYSIWRFDKRVDDFVNSYNISETVQLIEEWEQAVGIPDQCISTEYPLDDRRKHVIAKFKALGCATEADFIALAAYLGYTITIKQLGTFAYPPYDVPFIPISLPGARWIWIIEGHNVAASVPPYDVPFDVDTGSSILQCFFEKLKPVNTVLIFINT